MDDYDVLLLRLARVYINDPNAFREGSASLPEDLYDQVKYHYGHIYPGSLDRYYKDEFRLPTSDSLSNAEIVNKLIQSYKRDTAMWRYTSIEVIKDIDSLLNRLASS